MQKVKWLFFGYLAVTAILVAAFAGSVAFSRSSTSADPSRDKNTLYTIYASNVRWLDPAVVSDTTSADAVGCDGILSHPLISPFGSSQRTLDA